MGFRSLLTVKLVKNSNILAKSYFIVLKNFLKQTWNAFNTKCWPQWKDWKSVYWVRQVLTLFSNVIALVLSWNNIKALRVTKIFNQIKFETSFYWWWKENLVIPQRCLKMLWKLLSVKFSFTFEVFFNS